MNNASTGEVYNMWDDKKSLNFINKNVVDGVNALQSYQNSKKKAGVVENGGKICIWLEVW